MPDQVARRLIEKWVNPKKPGMKKTDRSEALSDEESLRLTKDKNKLSITDTP